MGGAGLEPATPACKGGKGAFDPPGLYLLSLPCLIWSSVEGD
jgi:hypothetical protein